jgi:hypothetical protein
MSDSAKKTISGNDVAKSAIVVTKELREVFSAAELEPVEGTPGGLAQTNKISLPIEGTQIRIELSYYKSMRHGSERRPEIRMWASEFAHMLSAGDAIELVADGTGLRLRLPRFSRDRAKTVSLLTSPFEGDLDSTRPLEILPRQKVVRTTEGRKRDAAFKIQILTVYDFRCAATGEVLSHEQRTPHVAAHIRPVKDDGPDHIRNGLLLHPVWHWAFDAGLWCIANDYTIQVSRKPTGRLGQILHSLNGKQLELPPGVLLDLSCIDWHRQRYFIS